MCGVTPGAHTIFLNGEGAQSSGWAPYADDPQPKRVPPMTKRFLFTFFGNTFGENFGWHFFCEHLPWKFYWPFWGMRMSSAPRGDMSQHPPLNTPLLLSSFDLCSRTFCVAGDEKSLACRYRSMTIEILHLLFLIKGMPWVLPRRWSVTLAHAERGLFEARKEGYLRWPAEDPLRSTEGRLRPTEDLRQADGALK